MISEEQWRDILLCNSLFIRQTTSTEVSWCSWFQTNSGIKGCMCRVLLLTSLRQWVDLQSEGWKIWPWEGHKVMQKAMEIEVLLKPQLKYYWSPWMPTVIKQRGDFLLTSDWIFLSKFPFMLKQTKWSSSWNIWQMWHWISVNIGFSAWEWMVRGRSKVRHALWLGYRLVGEPGRWWLLHIAYNWF